MSKQKNKCVSACASEARAGLRSDARGSSATHPLPFVRRRARAFCCISSAACCPRLDRALSGDAADAATGRAGGAARGGTADGAAAPLADAGNDGGAAGGGGTADGAAVTAAAGNEGCAAGGGGSAGASTFAPANASAARSALWILSSTVCHTERE